MEQLFNIQEELNKLPKKPGVYIMKDRHDTILYVGKAINLKNRVRQYFQKIKKVLIKTINSFKIAKNTCKKSKNMLQ